MWRFQKNIVKFWNLQNYLPPAPLVRLYFNQLIYLSAVNLISSIFKQTAAAECLDVKENNQFDKF